MIAQKRSQPSEPKGNGVAACGDGHCSAICAAGRVVGFWPCPDISEGCVGNVWCGHQDSGGRTDAPPPELKDDGQLKT
jgi:hypothetical protein